MPGRLLRPAAAVTLAMLVGACTPDVDTTTPTVGDPDPTTTTATTEAPREPARISDDCPPGDEPVDVPSVWPGARLEVVAGGVPLEIELAEAIDAPCLTIARTYAAAFDVPTPSLGTIEVVEETVIRYVPPAEPTAPDEPSSPWWGQDRVRACTPDPAGRLSCANLDIDVWRDDVVALAERSGATSRPTLLSPLARNGGDENGTSPSGLARMQDAYAGSWALALIGAAIESGSAPEEVRSACASTGTDPDRLVAAAQQILTDHESITDVTAVELATTLGREPPADLSTRSNSALQAVSAWFQCQLAP